jgi:SAM-dependent methyltransferase
MKGNSAAGPTPREGSTSLNERARGQVVHLEGEDMAKRNTKNEMVSFFTKYGLQFGKSEQAIAKHLLRLLGQERYDNFLDVTEAAEAGDVPRQALYELMETPAEANTLISIQSKVFLDVSAILYLAISPLIRPGTRVADLGCFTGAFASWVADNHPDCAVVGVDNNSKAIRFACELAKQQNAAFVQWDYSRPGQCPVEPCDFLLSTFGIDFHSHNEEAHCSLDVSDLRNSDYYRARKEEALPYFRCWKQAAKPEAALVAALRVRGIEPCLALVDAAHEAGWSLDLSNSSHVRVDEERFPIFHFQADGSTQPPTQNQLLGWWGEEEMGTVFDATYKDPFALVLYHALGEKTILETREKTYDGGHTMRKMIGTCGPFAFLFSRATTGYADLRLVPLGQVLSLRITF